MGLGWEGPGRAQRDGAAQAFTGLGPWAEAVLESNGSSLVFGVWDADKAEVTASTACWPILSVL